MYIKFSKHTARFSHAIWLIEYTTLRRLTITSSCPTGYSNVLLNNNVNKSIGSLPITLFSTDISPFHHLRKMPNLANLVLDYQCKDFVILFNKNTEIDKKTVLAKRCQPGGGKFYNFLHSFFK